MLGADFGGSGGDQPGEGGDQLAGLVKVLQVLGVLALGEPALDRRGAHQVHGGGRDDLDGGYLRDVADVVGIAEGGVRIGFRGTHAAKLFTDRLVLLSPCVRPETAGCLATIEPVSKWRPTPTRRNRTRLPGHFGTEHAFRGVHKHAHRSTGLQLPGSWRPSPCRRWFSTTNSRSDTSAIHALMIESASQRCGWLDPMANRWASSASKTHCVWPRSPTLIWLRWRRRQ